MFRRTSRPPIQTLLVRLGAFAGLVFGFSQGVLRPVEKAMNCSGGVCTPREETVSAADILLPMGLGVFGGMALGLLLAAVIGHLARTL